MRHQSIKPKVRRLVEVPEELKRAMQEVWPTVRHARKNPKKYLGIDDGIQTDRLIGGLEDLERKPFRFTFTPWGASKRSRWYLWVDHTEVEDIGDGHLKELKMYCCASPECEMKFSREDDTCFYCDWEDDDSSRSQDEMPNNPMNPSGGSGVS
jgi:hypothetical protein